jgi:GDPmannose 4,6-dehydratase
VVIDEKFYRPAEIHELRGDFSKARGKLGWKPAVPFKRLVQMMVDSDIKAREDLTRQDVIRKPSDKTTVKG